MGIEPQKGYRYRMRALRGAQRSAYSNEALALTPAYVAGDNTCNFRVTVTVGGPGTVSVTPAGVGCGAGCYAYCAGTQVSLGAFPATGSAFSGWSGSCAGVLPSCTLTVDGDKAVAATFQ